MERKYFTLSDCVDELWNAHGLCTRALFITDVKLINSVLQMGGTMIFSHIIKLVLSLWSPWQTLLSSLAQKGDSICESHPVHTPRVTELGHCKNAVQIITQGKLTQRNRWKLYKQTDDMATPRCG